MCACVCERDLRPSLSLKLWPTANSGSRRSLRGDSQPSRFTHSHHPLSCFICAILFLFFLLCSSLFSTIHSFFDLCLICFIGSPHMRSISLWVHDTKQSASDRPGSEYTVAPNRIWLLKTQTFLSLCINCIFYFIQ